VKVVKIFDNRPEVEMFASGLLEIILNVFELFFSDHIKERKTVQQNSRCNWKMRLFG